MIAIVEIGGKQYTVTPDATITVDAQNLEVGKTLEVSPLLIASEDAKTFTLGAPLVSKGKVAFEVVSHQKWDKVRVFKIKSKKRYVRNRGFRPSQTTLRVTSIA